MSTIANQQMGGPPTEDPMAVIRYEITDAERARIENECKYHSPTEEQVQRYKELRSLEKHVKLQFHALAPSSRERSIALTELDKAFMMVRAAIARNE